VDRNDLQSLRDFQIAQARAWLAGEAARATWIEQTRRGFERVLDLRVDQLLERASFERMVAAAMATEVLDGLARPLVGFLFDQVTDAARSIPTPLGDLAGEEARRALETLVEHPEVVDARLVRAITRDPALEGMMRDVLFEALVAFNERSNPFVASWGVPALLDALPRLGRTAIRGTFDRVRAEFERRLEPEMRRFLEGFARQSLDHTIDRFEEKAAEPEVVAARRHALDVLLSEPLRDLVWPPNDARHEAARAAVEALAVHLVSTAEVRKAVEAHVDAMWSRFAHRTLREALEELSITPPDPEPFAAACWPALRSQLVEDALLAELGKAIDATHEAWLASRS
jgi:hypothetical protein